MDSLSRMQAWVVEEQPILDMFVSIVYVPGIYLFALAVLKLLSFILNTLSDSYSKKLNTVMPKIYFDKTFKITIQSLVLNQAALDAINLTLHYNCQFEEFSIAEVNIRLFPYIHVEVDGIVFKGFALPPSKWSMEGVIAALKSHRLNSLDDITRRLYKVLYRSFKVTKYVEGMVRLMFLKMMHFVDIIIGTAYCDITNVDASFCAIRNFTSTDITVLAHIGHIEVQPCSGLHGALFTPMFKMSVRVEDVSLTSRYISTDELAAPPMLAPLTVVGVITLPKIVSQMIRKEALPTKYCHLDLKAPHVIVDLGRINTEGLLNFSLAIIYYRMWYTGVMAFFEKTLEVAVCPDIDPQTALTNYVALYSNYAQAAGYSIHIDRSKSIFGYISDENNPTYSLRQKCRLYEEHMSTEEVIHARVLALGWKEKKQSFHSRMNVVWADNDGDFFKTMKRLYEQEALSHKEMRHIQVKVTAEQVDFLLSTPRTTAKPLHMDMTNYPAHSHKQAEAKAEKESRTPMHNNTSKQKSNRRFSTFQQVEVPPPVMFSVYGIDLMVMDPIVPASYSFDKVRDVVVGVKRMRIAAPTSCAEQIPTTEFHALDQTVLDVFDIADDKAKHSQAEEMEEEMEEEEMEEGRKRHDSEDWSPRGRCDSRRFENASSCSDLASIPRLKTEKTIFATEKVHTRVLNANSFHVGQHNRATFKTASKSVPMVFLNIHEDPEYQLLSVEATLSNTLILADVSNLLGIVEYTLDLVKDVSFSLQHWSTSVDILQASVEPTALPTCLLEGKRMKIVAKANNLGLGCQEPNFKDEDGRAKLFVYTFNAAIYMISNSSSESMTGHIVNPVVSTYELFRGLCKRSSQTCVQTFNIVLRPSTLICNLMDDYRCDFKYCLYKEKTIAPAIFTEDEIKGIKTSHNRFANDSTKSFYNKRKSKETVEQVKQSNILFRHIHWRADPFVVNISEQELNILIHWLEHALTAAKEGSLDLELDMSRMKSTAEALNTNASMEEFTHKMNKLFQTHNISSDDKIYANVLRNLFLCDEMKAALLDSELANHENDLMFLFDPELKGYTTLNCILSHCRDICDKCSWDPRGNVPMFFKDFIGIRPSSIFSDSIYDSAALSTFWSVIEEQTRIRRASGKLADIPPAAVQMLLVRLCGDGTLARTLWEKIIRNNLKDKHDNLYPWVINDDHEIFRVPTSGEIIRNKISGTDNDRFAQFTSKSEKLSLLKQKVHTDSEDYLEDIDMSVTSFDIAAGTLQFNYLDTLLGPLLPRFQVSVSDIYFGGCISHLGIVPDLSFTSNYSLVSRLFGGITLESCFFNSAVSSHEPIIEPFSLEFGAVNVPTDETEFSIHLKDTNKLKLIVSSALLETMSSAIFCIIDNKNTNEADRFEKIDFSLPTSIDHESTLPSFIIINRCGLDLTVQTYVTDLEEERTETSDPLNSISAAYGRVTPVSIPWSTMYRSYSDNCFPEVLISSKKTGGSHHFTTGSPVPLHSLSVARLFLTQESVDTNFAQYSPSTFRRMQSSSSDPERHRGGTQASCSDSFKAGVILESKNNHEFNCGIVFLARSNVRFRNMTGSALCLRADSLDGFHDESKFDILNFEVKGLPLPLITQKELSFALQNTDGSWTKAVSLLGLIGCDSRRLMIGGYLLYIESTRHYHEKDNVEMYDYLIEIVSGVRLVNALPYRIEIKYTQEKDADQSWIKMSSNALNKKTLRVKIESGEEHLIPVSLQNINDLQLSFRLDSFAKENHATVTTKLRFSEPIDLTDFFDKNSPNITVEDVQVHYPNIDASCFFKRSIRVRKVRDSSKEEVYSSYLSTPTIEFHADLWVQNNSGIPLFYKFKDVKGKYLEVQDSEYGCNQVSPDTMGEECLTHGPVLGLLECEKIQLKIDTERDIVANEITMHKCTNLKTHINLPNAVHSGIFKNSSWSKQVSISSNAVMTGEIECDGIWLGISIGRGKGVFSNTTIAVITPRFLIHNKTSLDIDFFPVRLWKRMRKSSTDNESQAMRNLAKSIEKHQSLDAVSEEQQTLQNMLFNDKEQEEDQTGAELKSPTKSSVDVSGSPIMASKPHSACTFFSFSSGQRKISNFMNSEYSALAMRINESANKMTNPLNSIVVGIISASNLASADILGSSDPFCEVYWQGELVHTTAYLLNTLDPFWDESVRLHMKPEALRMSELKFIVYDYDMGGQKEFLGQITLTHKDLISHPGKMMEKTLMQMPSDKEKRKGQTQGKIRLMIDFNRDETFNTWTAPVPIGNPISEAVSASTSDGDRHLLAVNVQESSSFNIVTISEHSASNLPAFMIVNRVQDCHLRFRQKHTNVLAYPRQIVRPMEYLYYAWDDCNLPKIIDLVAVDQHGNESPAESYVLENVGKKHAPLNVSMLDNNRKQLLVKVIIEGHTRKLVISNNDQEMKSKSFLKYKDQSSDATTEFLINNHLRVMCSLSGLSLSLIDEVPRELIHFTIDDIEIYTLPHSNKIQLTIRHLQLDNMLSDSDYQVVLSPFDAGYNSHLNEDYNYFTKECIPFLDMTMEIDYSSLSKDTIIIEYFEMKTQELNLFLDFNFIVRMASSMITPNVLDAVSRITRVAQSQMLLLDMRTHVNTTLVQAVSMPKAHTDMHTLMLFFKKLILHSIGVRITLSVALKKDVDIDPRRIGSQVEYSTIQNLMSLSRGITNINPHFVFGSISITNAFDTMDGIGWRLAKFYISSAGLQALRLLGSAEIIGDPAGGLVSLGSSLRMFAIKTKSEMEGQAPVRAEGLKHLVQGVASISFGTVSKVANSVGEQLASVTGSDFKTDMAAKNPSHVGKGALQGGSIFFKTCKAGVTNVYKKPMEGYRKRSISKTAKGVVTGISGLALAPIVGALGATAKLTKGIEATAHVFDDKPVGRIRPARSLFYSPQIRPLEKSVFLVQFSLCIRGLDLDFVSQRRTPFYNFLEEFDMDEDITPQPSPMGTTATGGGPRAKEYPSRADGQKTTTTSANVASHTVVVHMKYGSEEKVSKEFPLAKVIRMSEKDLMKLDFKVKSKKGKFEKRMIRISIRLKHKNVFGTEVTIAKGLLHPLDLVNFLHHEEEVPLPARASASSSAASSASSSANDLHPLDTIEETPEDVVWQYKENQSRHRFELSNSLDYFNTETEELGNTRQFTSLNRKNRESHESATPSVISDLHSTSGVSVSRGVGRSKMSQYILSMIDKPNEHISESERQFINELNAYVTYPEEVISSSTRKSFIDSIADSHTSTKGIFSVDCSTKVAAKKKNMKKLFFLRDFLAPTTGKSVTPVSSDSASTLTMTTVPVSNSQQHQATGQLLTAAENDAASTPQQKELLREQMELYRVAEALRFRLFLSGSFVSAPSVYM